MFAILKSFYGDINIKPKQVISLKKLFLNVDLLAVLTIGYGKLLLFHFPPALCLEGNLN